MTARTTGLAAISALLAVSGTALAAHPRPAGVYTSTKADLHVSKDGNKVLDAEINCKQIGQGQTLQAIHFSRPIEVTVAGRFSYHGQAEYTYFTRGGVKARMTTASLRGTFVSPKQVRGTVKRGPKACGFVRFAAAYNPSAH